ncbi:hypothetical protein Q3G72_031558 [Acer saccharum]|nr:hypothetical protein Q3G72_031558 [Acer saccharum]
MEHASLSYLYLPNRHATVEHPTNTVDGVDLQWRKSPTGKGRTGSMVRGQVEDGKNAAARVESCQEGSTNKLVNKKAFMGLLGR